MKWTIIVTDTFVRFRLAAIEAESPRPQTWELEVMTIEQVAETLVSLRFLDTEAAHRLTEASTTITPQPGLMTVPFCNFRRSGRDGTSRRRTGKFGSTRGRCPHYQR